MNLKLFGHCYHCLHSISIDLPFSWCSTVWNSGNPLAIAPLLVLGLPNCSGKAISVECQENVQSFEDVW